MSGCLYIAANVSHRIYTTNHCVSRGAFPSAHPDLMSAMAELNLRESGDRFPRK